MKNKNIVIFASCLKHACYLNSIVDECWGKLNTCYMLCEDTLLKNPSSHPQSFQVGHNVENPKSYFSQTLNINLPFKPDWLILSRERWFPEEQIIPEFKQKWGTKVALVEPNSAFINSVNQFLESESKNRFVKNIDVFFDHSEFTKTQRKLLGFKGNSVVVGNPKYDSNLDVNKQDLDTLKTHYNIDPNKKQVIFYTLINKFRYKLFDEFKKFKEQHPEYQYFIKPYPGEPFLKWKNEYFPKFLIEGVTPILEESHIWGMYNICDIHIGTVSSVMYPSFLLNKEVHDFSLQIGYNNNLESNEDILNNSGGDEEDINLWKRVFNINDEEFKQMTSKKNILPMLKNNKKFWELLSNLTHHHKDVLKLFDEFNDRQASKRIVKYIKNN